MRAKRKYHPLVDIFRGVEGNLSLGRGNLLEKRGGKQMKELQELERVYRWTLWSPLRMHLGVHHGKICKGLVGTWMSLGIWTGWGGALYPDSPRAKDLSILLSSDDSAADWSGIWVQSSAYSFATSIKKKFKQKLCTNSVKKPLWPWIFPPSSDVAGDAFFQMLILCCFQTEPF